MGGIRKFVGGRCCAIGDGGNDVSMILSANVGVGIVGKEGKQASLAADFSITHFCHLKRLLLWHGRNSYLRSARLSQFVIHRGLIISIIQSIFSAIFYFVALPIFQGWLMIGYSTYYTMMPVFSLCLDEELPEKTVFLYPELYQSLRKGRMSLKVFFGFVWIAIYQGSIIMLLAMVLFEDRLLNIVAITFTALVASELLNVCSEVNRWHPLMVVAQILTVLIYCYSLIILRSYFDVTFVATSTFAWKTFVIVAVSWVPTHMWKACRKCWRPAQHHRLL